MDHPIDLKPGTELPYMHIYNMSPAELKALDDYIKDALAKGWIHESQSVTGPLSFPLPRISALPMPLPGSGNAVHACLISARLS